MAKQSMIQREKKRFQLFIQHRLKRSSLKNQMKHASSFKAKLEIQFQLQKLPRNSSATRLHNRCMQTGRPRGFYRDFGLSRHNLREMAHKGLLPGVTKASW
jgi:small subunit ribosomal protein S14